MSLKPTQSTDDPQPAADESQISQSYFQALYEVFWKHIFAVCAVAFSVVAIAVVHLFTDDPMQYAYGLAIMIAIPIAYLTLEWFARAVRWDEGPILNWGYRPFLLGVAGYAVALALYVFLTIHEASERASAQRHAEASRREQEQMRQILQSPDFQAANEFLRARQSQSTPAQTSDPAPSP